MSGVVQWFCDFRIGVVEPQFQMEAHTYLSPGYQINFRLLLNTDYNCLSITDSLHWSLKQSQVRY